MTGGQGGAADRAPRRGAREPVSRAVEGVVRRAPYGQRVVRAARLRLRRILGRGVTEYPHRDAYVVGYPKVGNTWFQIMLRMALVRYYRLDDEWLSRIIYPQVTGGEPPPAPVPHIELTHDMTSFPEGEYHQVQHDHRRYRGKPVVLLIREPKDALVSLYMHYVHRDEATPWEGTADEMVHDAEFGLAKYLQFYRAWYRHRRWPSGLYLVRYEEMKADTAGVFRAAAEFLGMTGISEAVIDECVAFGSFDNMRRMEEENALGLPALARSPRGTPARTRSAEARSAAIATTSPPRPSPTSIAACGASCRPSTVTHSHVRPNDATVIERAKGCRAYVRRRRFHGSDPGDAAVGGGPHRPHRRL